MDSLEIYKYAKERIRKSKEHYRRYSSSPKCLQEMWDELDLICFKIMGVDSHSYFMGVYRREHGMQAMDFVTYIQTQERIVDEEETYKRLVEWRDEYEKWLREQLAKDAPSIADML